MSWTKRELVLQAFEEIGYASYVYDLQPEQLQAALRRLDGMMAEWNAIGIRIGYPLPSSPSSSDLDDTTAVPDAANSAIYTNLAMRIAPSVGKQVQQETKQAADTGYKALVNKLSHPIEMQLSGTLPNGAGNKSRRQVYIVPPSEKLTTGDDSEITFE